MSVVSCTPLPAPWLQTWSAGGCVARERLDPCKPQTGRGREGLGVAGGMRGGRCSGQAGGGAARLSGAPRPEIHHPDLDERLVHFLTGFHYNCCCREKTGFPTGREGRKRAAVGGLRHGGVCLDRHGWVPWQHSPLHTASQPPLRVQHIAQDGALHPPAHARRRP